MIVLWYCYRYSELIALALFDFLRLHVVGGMVAQVRVAMLITELFTWVPAEELCRRISNLRHTERRSVIAHKLKESTAAQVLESVANGFLFTSFLEKSDTLVTPAWLQERGYMLKLLSLDEQELRIRRAEWAADVLYERAGEPPHARMRRLHEVLASRGVCEPPCDDEGVPIDLDAFPKDYMRALEKEVERHLCLRIVVFRLNRRVPGQVVDEQ